MPNYGARNGIRYDASRYFESVDEIVMGWVSLSGYLITGRKQNGVIITRTCILINDYLNPIDIIITFCIEE